jgi:hypothetical protein
LLPLTTIAGALLSPTPTALIQKKENLARLLAPIKWPSARSFSTAKSCHPLATYFSLGSLLTIIHGYGFSVGESLHIQISTSLVFIKDGAYKRY